MSTIVKNHVIILLIVSSLSLTLTDGNSDNRTKQMKSFPPNFEFGVSTAAFQIEGAWNIDGKGLSMWDYMCHTNPDIILDGTNADHTAHSYHLYKRDIEMLKELGVKNYRFSIPWTRILPQGWGNINPLGIEHYKNVIDELIKNDIVPFVTIYHWDLPQKISELGGWLNEDVVDWYGNYSRILFENFGDRVKNWITVNEPHIHCFLSYGYGYHPPKIQSPGIGFYECGRNLLLANARAYHTYVDEFKESQKGQLGIVLSMKWGLPQSDSEDDKDAAKDYFAFFLGQYMDPIFGKEGNYPKRLIDRVAEASSRQGLNSSRLRPFTQDQVNYIKGTADFLGLNHYTSVIVYRNDSLKGKYDVPSFNDDGYFDEYQNASWPVSESPWIREYSPGFYKLLIYLKNEYDNPTIYVTENGFPTTSGLDDDTRVHYFNNYWSALLDALNDGCNVKGYFVWSLMDNFEWSFGYTQKFGLYEVNMNDPQRRRSPRKSALVYKKLIKTRTIDLNYNPDPYKDEAIRNRISLVYIIAIIFINLLL